MRNKGWKFHHIGIASTNLRMPSSQLRKQGFEHEGSFADPLQGVSGEFLTAFGLRIELLEALDDSETLKPWTANGNRCYQIAFEVENIEEAITESMEDGARLIRKPLPAVAFDGRLVAFVMPFPGLIIEFIEIES